MITFAYDGTINGDWVSHYAVRLAFRHETRKLRMVHVDEHCVPPTELVHRIEQIAERCRQFSVTLETVSLPLQEDVFSTLDRAIERGSDHFLVCGTRVRERSRGFLTGSVGDRMLQHGARQVLVLRVVQPGLLGAPRDLLFPVTIPPQRLGAALPYLGLFAAELRRFHVLHVQQVGRLGFRCLSPQDAAGMRHAGLEYCRRIELELQAKLGLDERIFDAHVAIADDVSREIILHAGRLKTDLIYLGTSDRSLSRMLFGVSPLEAVLRSAPCDVAIYRGLP